MLSTNGYVVPGVPEIYVVSKASNFYTEMFKKNFQFV